MRLFSFSPDSPFTRLQHTYRLQHLPTLTSEAGLQSPTLPTLPHAYRLQNLPTLTSEAGLQSPTLLIIGEVVALAPGWQEWEANGMPLEWRQSHRPRYEQYEQYKQYGLGPSSNNNIVVKAAPTATWQTHQATHQATAIDRYQ